MGGDEAPPPLSVTGQPLEGAPAVVNLLHFRFHSSNAGNANGHFAVTIEL